MESKKGQSDRRGTVGIITGTGIIGRAAEIGTAAEADAAAGVSAGKVRGVGTMRPEQRMAGTTMKIMTITGGNMAKTAGGTTKAALSGNGAILQTGRVMQGALRRTKRRTVNRAAPDREGLVRPHERLDELHRNGYFIIQDRGRFCFGMDAVLLSGFAQVKPGERALDLGAGTGIIPILLEAKTKGEHFTGLEIQPESADMAARSVAYNGLEERIDIVTGDIKEASALFGASSFEVVTTNPPYMIGSHGLVSSCDAKTIARHEVLCDLDDVLRESAKLLVPGGRFYMVHRPFRLAEIFSKMVAYRIEPKRMRLVYPFVDKEPNMVLIEGSRGGRSRLAVEPPLIVFREPGVYTEEITELYGY